MRRGRQAILAAVVVAFLGVALFGYYQVTVGGSRGGSSSPSVDFVTGTGVESASDTLFTTSCSTSGGGAFGLLVVSDSSGTPVQGETVNAVDRLRCGSEAQVVYLDNFSVGQGGWLAPVFPVGATVLGVLNFTVTYQGSTYHFSTSYADLGANCVTLHLPSGNVTTSAVMRYPCA